MSSRSIVKASPPADSSMLYFVRQPRKDMLAFLAHLQTQGDFVQLAPAPFYFVNHPDYVQQVLVTQAKAFDKPSNVKRVVEGAVGYNLFSADGETWRALRKAIQPAFHMQRISSYLDVTVEYMQRIMADWHDGQHVEMQDAMMDLTLAATNKALFDIDFYSDPRSDAIGEAILQFLDYFNERLTALFPLPGWVPTEANRKMAESVEIGEAYFQPMIEQRRASGDDRGDLLSMLLQAQANDETGILTDEQIRTEILNLAAAGYEVTTFTLLFTLYCIAQHDDVQQTLIDELDAVLGDDSLTMDTLDELTYLNQVIDEAMRLYPVTALLSREANQPVTIDGYELPQGAQVIIAPWVLHRREDIYPQPDEFRPERFAPENADEIPKHAYIPFSTGPRVCIGNSFAMLQMRAALATLFQQYRVELAPDYELRPVWRFNTRPADGLPLLLRAR